MGESPANSVQLQALLDRAAQGDDQAYGELLSVAQARHHKLARKMLRDFPLLQSLTSQIPTIPESARNEIAVLVLQGSDMTDDDLRLLGRFGKLTHLYISGTAVTDNGIRHL